MTFIFLSQFELSFCYSQHKVVQLIQTSKTNTTINRVLPVRKKKISCFCDILLDVQQKIGQEHGRREFGIALRERLC